MFLISGVYFSKKRITILENKIYEALLISTIIGLVINILSFMLDKFFGDLLFLRLVFIKIYYSYILLFLFLMSLYLIVSSGDKGNMKNSVGIFFALVLLINFFLPVQFEYVKDQIYIIGVSIYFLYAMFAISFIGWGLYILINLKKSNKKKYIPMFLYILLSIPVIIVQSIFPELLLEPIWITFILVLMYHTIENPDLKMLNELELAKGNAERANEAKTDFLSSMSHEIRTPLNAIVGFSNSIMDDESLDDAKNNAKDIIMASNNLLEIVNGILDISKIEAGKMEIVESEYNLLDILNNIKKLIIPRIGDKPIDFKTNFSNDLPHILYGDSSKVREVISNLLTNASKYTEEGFIEFSVGCINKDNKTKLIISVEDSGRGIKPEKIDKLFTKFERLEEDKNTTLEGTGLGLAITKSLVEMMGGKIVVQSVYGCGSQFTVYLEQKIVKMISDKKEVVEENTYNYDYSNKKILVVDDNKMNLKVATNILKKYNIVPDTVLSGKECIDILNNNTYDLILMDDMMPNMSGTETLKELKKNQYFNTPVVVLTANAIAGMKEKYFSNGFNDYLAKPIEKNELDRILKEYLNNQYSLFVIYKLNISFI